MDCSPQRKKGAPWLLIGALALSAGGCATAPRAWDEVPRPTSERWDSGGEAAYARESVEEIYTTPESVQYNFEQAPPEGEYMDRATSAQGAPAEGRDADAPDLSDWGAAPPTPEPAPRYAQAEPPQPRRPGSGGAGTPAGPAATTTDAVPADTALLIYTAVLTVAVLHVEEQQTALQQLAESVGGHLARRDARSIVVRIPVRRFHEVLRATEAAGDVLDRQVETQDVSEEFRDTTIRLRNLEVMRTRLETLLTQASNVNDALAVEREMQRVTDEIERLRGRIRYLEDQISYSTITVYFRPRAAEIVRVDEFRLPFRWLDRLGLPRLLEVR